VKNLSALQEASKLRHTPITRPKRRKRGKLRRLKAVKRNVPHETKPEIKPHIDWGKVKTWAKAR